MKSFFLALQFLTIIPIKSLDRIEHQELGRSTAFFPIVGAIQGLILVGVDWVISRFLPSDVVNGLMVAILVLTNGGFHLDGLADTIDGLTGGKDREDALRIMRDSQIGAIGVVAVVLVLMLKFLAISNLPDGSRDAILFLFPVMGRWAMVPMAYLAPYAREGEGLGKAFTEYATWKELTIATGIVVILSVTLIGWRGLVYVGIMFAIVYLLTIFFKKKLGGITGDVLGFQSELGELTFLILTYFQ
ncbi:MAG: adenosylcobinamide-GDP ribazoletransferase [Deltaproteobacteria bacterium]|nr:adenosylcobinamide-GDP ribazoletransferase [Deltaproteobacteria bacterium]